MNLRSPATIQFAGFIHHWRQLDANTQDAFALSMFSKLSYSMREVILNDTADALIQSTRQKKNPANEHPSPDSARG